MKYTTLFRSSTEENIFVSFLRLLQVKHTRIYSDRYYREHPYKYNMFGLKRMLSDYGIASEGLQLSGIDDLKELSAPYIAHNGGNFVVVTATDNQQISYLWEGKQITNTLDEFSKTWSKTVLIGEPNATSAEPDYQKNRREELFNTLLMALISVFIVVLGVLLFTRHQLWTSVGMMLSIVLNLIGIYTCHLLMKKQLHIQSRYADKICSLFKKSDCNNVLESSASKLFGIISWSEVGLGYFAANLLLIFFIPALIPWLAWINICALPYAVWSVWYQKRIAKQWCPLCLIVQLLFVSIFVVNLLFGYIQIPSISTETIFTLGVIYALPPVALMSITPLIRFRYSKDNTAYEMNSLKMKEDVFRAILEKQPYHKVTLEDSKIIWGNAEAPLRITVLTNPFCAPCSRMHDRLEKLLEQSGNQFSVQYIFSAFNDDLKKANYQLVAIYENNLPTRSAEIFKEWYTTGKLYWDRFSEKYNYDRAAESVVAEIGRHEAWKDAVKLNATPTILLNGYELPREYKVEDLVFFTDIEIKVPRD